MTGSTSTPGENLIPCIACSALISPAARLCPTCRSWQTDWKNQLAYFGSTTGFLAILASAITFIVSQAAGWYRTATWEERVAPVYFEYPGDSGFINSGSGDLVIASVDVSLPSRPDATNFTVRINQPVKQGSLTVVTTESPYGRPTKADQAVWAKNPSGSISPKLLAEALRNTDQHRCAELHLYNARNLVFRRIDMMEPGKRLVSMPVAANLNFVSLHTGEAMSVPLPDMRAAFLFIEGNRPECTDAAYGIE